MNDLLPELFLELALRLDNSSLRQLYYTTTQLRGQVKQLVASQSFWKKIAESLIATGWSVDLAMGMSKDAPIDADWKTIYQNLAKAEQHFIDVAKHNRVPEREGGRWSMDLGHSHIKIDPHQYGLNDLGTMLVMMGLYGPPDWKKEENVWRTIHNPSVLSLLLKSGYLKNVSVDHYMRPIGKNVATDNLAAVLALIDMYPGDKLNTIVNRILGLTVAVPGADMTRAIVERYPGVDLDLVKILERAVEENNSTAFTYISPLGHFTAEQLVKIVSTPFYGTREDKDVSYTVALALKGIRPTRERIKERGYGAS